MAKRDRPSISVSIAGLVAGMCVLWIDAVPADEWPTYQHDIRRSGFTAEKFDAEKLILDWSWKSANPPQPAWAGPAKWDAYSGQRNLPSMRNYDPVFHAISVGGSVYFGSSADDSVYCLDAATGNQRWSFTTGGPVRVAPCFSGGKIYFGSDDGYAYCLRAGDGSLRWRFRPVEPEQLILNNGRFIPFHPCRTGVLVEQGVAYFGHSLLPWRESYLCAVNAATGGTQGKGLYVKRLRSTTLEGAPAASSQFLIFPQGRVAPRVYNRVDGRDLGSLKKSGGGSVVVISLDSKVFHGPAADTKKGAIKSSDVKTREIVAGYGRGNALVVAGTISYMLTDDALIASDLLERKVLWKVPCSYPHALIAAGRTLFAGGTDAVAAFDARNGKQLWEHAVEGKAFGLAAANGRLLVSTDVGAIYSFREGKSSALLTKRPEQPIRKSASAATPRTIGLAAGPWLQFSVPGEAVVRWRTEQPSPTRLDYRLHEQPTTIEDRVPKIEHEVRLAGLKRNRIYEYTIRIGSGETEQVTQPFECDTFFNYSLPPVPQRPNPFAASDANRTHVRAAKRILARTGIERGICLVLGSNDGGLAYELVRQSRLRVIGVESDPRKVAASREKLKAAGVYGSRVSIHHVQRLNELPFVGHFANLVVSDRLLSDNNMPFTAAETFRVLRPDGGVAYLGQFAGADRSLTAVQLRSWLAAASLQAQLQDDKTGIWARIERGLLPGAGEWSHLYGRSDNSAFGGEELAGVKSAKDLAVQWIGRPGPRYQADRNGRKPSPLSTAGRLFLQGLHRIVALDAFNGSVLWSLEIPDLERFNMPRDCGNWCADRKFVYAAIHDKCWQIDAATGRVSAILNVTAAPEKTWKQDWGYLASEEGMLIGTAVKQGTSWTNYWGGSGAGWYDDRKGAVTHKLCSDNLFAIDKTSGKRVWNYSDGVVLNTTISIDDGQVFFVECRNPKVTGSPERRIGSPELWKDQFLVALDAKTGYKLWERPIDTFDGTVVFYMAKSKDRIITVASGEKRYHVDAFSAENGAHVWNQSFGWLGGKGDHGKAMSRPAIVGEKVYVRPKAFSLADGKLANVQMPGGGCGTYACTAGALFFRAGTVTVWDREKGSASTWKRLRPDCWLSTIPAGGMLLSPEGGGGCSCGGWMETSIGFMPLAHRRPQRQN